MASVTLLSEVYRQDLQCYVDTMEYDFEKHEGTVHTTGYPDMPACAALYEKFDPEVRAIHTVVEGRPDTVYKKCAPERNPAYGDGWQAYRPAPRLVTGVTGERNGSVGKKHL